MRLLVVEDDKDLNRQIVEAPSKETRGAGSGSGQLTR